MYNNEEEGFSAPLIQNYAHVDFASSASKSQGDKKAAFGMFNWDWESSDGDGEEMFGKQK